MVNLFVGVVFRQGEMRASPTSVKPRDIVQVLCARGRPSLCWRVPPNRSAYRFPCAFRRFTRSDVLK